VLPWWPKEATLNLASEETLTLAGSSRYRWRNHLVMGGGIISLQVAASVGISIKLQVFGRIQTFRTIRSRFKNFSAILSKCAAHLLSEAEGVSGRRMALAQSSNIPLK
jgi:hypothetical protein